MEDRIVLVDLFDNEIGGMEKYAAHKNASLHRAFSVFLIRREGAVPEMLLQKRNRNKYHSGGLWTNACCSHPRIGEELEASVKRRLMEELGIECEVREVFDFCYFHRFSEDCAEFEYDHVFLGECGCELSPDPDEIEEIIWLPFPELKEMMLSQPDSFSVWFMTAAPRVMLLAEEMSEQ